MRKRKLLSAIALSIVLAMTFTMGAGAASYVVKPGDVLWKIGKALGYSYEELASYNGIKNPNKIYVGQVITTPDTEVTQPDTEVTQPDPEPTKPDPEPTKPDPEPTKPDPEPTKPDPEPTKPDPEPTKPDPEPTKPDPTGSSASATATGFGGAVEVTATVLNGKVTAITVNAPKETVGIGDKATKALPEKIVAAGNANVDNIAGATVTSTAIKKAAEEAISKAIAAEKGTAPTPVTGMKAGTYTASAQGHGSLVKVEVNVTESSIEKVSVVSNGETAGLRNWPINIIPAAIVKNQTIGVDMVNGATMTSRAIITATEDCLKQAGADMAKFAVAAPKSPVKDVTKTADVVIVGGGGAGMSAAIEAGQAGASVVLIEKMGTLGGNSIMVGGIYNTPDETKQKEVKMTPNVATLIENALKEKSSNTAHAALQAEVQKEYDAYKAAGSTHLFDSINWQALQTWNGGDKVANLDLVKKLAANSHIGLDWLKGMGMEFKPSIIQGTGSLYQRTHSAVLPNGTGYFKAFIETLQKMPNVEIIMDTTGKSLIMDGDKVVGVNALALDGSKVTLNANNGVIITTGGFAGNVALRQEYCQGEKWPDLGANLVTSNMPGVTGDGIFMARDAGAALVDMEQIQLLQVCNPKSGTTADLVAPSDVIGYVFVNQEGKRFVDEGGRRDVVSKGIIAQTGSVVWLLQSADTITDPTKTKSLGGRLLTEFLETGDSGYISAPTLAEIAVKMGVPADALKVTIDAFNKNAKAQTVDEFGRTQFKYEYANGPWYAYPRAAAAHHTMGGIRIDTDAHALHADGTVVEGLFAAGEVTGGIHGGNRLGGNAIVDFVVFGRTAGISAAAAKTSTGAKTYKAEARGHNGMLNVEVTLSEGRIESVKVPLDKNIETAGLRRWPISIIPAAIVKNQSIAVDTVTGATLTSRAILTATEDCLKQAGVDVAKFSVPVAKTPAKDETVTADVIIVGGGGAGMTAAIEASDAGASVILIEKMGTLGGNSIMAGGIYNTPNPERQKDVPMTPIIASLIEKALAETPTSPIHTTVQAQVKKEYEEYKASGKTHLFDSPSWQALQTWNGGDKVANLELVNFMAQNSFAGLQWLLDKGLEIKPGVTQGAGSLYQRTHGEVLPNSTGYFKAYMEYLKEKDNVKIIMDTTAKDLITEGGAVVGVNAVDKNGSKITLKANKGVILATGGFAGNVELRQKYCQGEKWPNLGSSLATSNMPGVTGDGIFMAEAAGAQLIDMEQIQLLQVCNPVTGTTADHAGGMGVDGYMFVNAEGKRFAPEDGRRDDISKAMITQTGGTAWLIHSGKSIKDPNTMKTLGGRPVADMVKSGESKWFMANTIEELSEKTGMPLDALKTTMDEFNKHVENKTKDEFGRVLFTMKSEAPWYGYLRAPAAHHTMGGVRIDVNTRALRADGTAIKGLYCAGEITGGIHGGNRLGGNAMVDFTVFGRVAGASAAAGK